MNKSKFILTVTTFLFVIITTKAHTPIIPSNKTTSHQNIKKTKVLKDENAVMIGTWTGEMSGKKLTIVITEIKGKELKGYNILGTNKRALKGSFVLGAWDQPCSKAFDAVLKEPGDDKWDGVFTIKFVGYEDEAEVNDGLECKGNLKGQEAMGEWKANNGKMKKQFNLVKKQN